MENPDIDNELSRTTGLKWQDRPTIVQKSIDNAFSELVESKPVWGFPGSSY